MPTPRRHATAAARQAAHRARLAEARFRAASAAPPPEAPLVPGYRRWKALIRHAELLLQRVTVEMAEYYEARPEGWREGEQGEALQDRMAIADEAHGLLEDWGAA